MADDFDDEIASAPTGGIGAPSPAALTAAMAGPAAATEEARDLLREQKTLTMLQVKILHEQHALELSHLRWRRFNDQMKGALQIMVVLVGLLIIAGLGAAIWAAAQDDSVVVDAFSVPANLAARGITGQAVAAQLLDKLVAMENATVAARPAGSYSSDWGNDIKVDIPSTGVSVGEFRRLLVSWFGHETHISGEVFSNGSQIDITARAAGGGNAKASGQEPEMDKLLQSVAEQIYRRTQPFRYAVFLENEHQMAPARAIFSDLAENAPAAQERAWGYVGLAGAANIAGDRYRALDYDYKALALYPGWAMAYIRIHNEAALLGHTEESLAAGRKAIELLRSGKTGGMSERARNVSLPGLQSRIANDLDDYSASLSYEQAAARLPDYFQFASDSRGVEAIIRASLHDGKVARAIWQLSSRSNDSDQELVSLVVAIALEDAPSIRSASASLARLVASKDWTDNDFKARKIWPLIAYAETQIGQIKDARALIDRTPTDCNECQRIRGDVSAAEMNWDEAERWFARAVSSAPSIPDNDFDWGRALLARGDDSGAIAKFRAAHSKGPHWSDPLEMWGEALMQENRSDLALAEFAEANKYAPNWGRLHLEWGKALFYAGKKDDANKQFALASTLDLSTVDKASLAKWATHRS